MSEIKVTDDWLEALSEDVLHRHNQGEDLGDLVSTADVLALVKHICHLESGGWTKIEEGSAMPDDGELVEWANSRGYTSVSRHGRDVRATHWRYATPLPEAE